MNHIPPNGKALPDDHLTLIVDDHPLYRQGIRLALQQLEWLGSLAEAGSATATLAQMRHRPANVVLLDIALPDNDGLNLLEKLLTLYPELIIIVVSSFDDRSYVDRALDLGARGYLIKDCAVDELHDCLRDVVLDGHIFISNSIGARQPRLPEREDGQSLAIDALTPGERKVMAQLAHCLTSKEIAKELGISHRTVQNHRQKISSKLGVSGMHQLMKIAQRHFPTGSGK